MKLTDILNGSYNPQEWEAKGYELPKYDLKAVKEKTYAEPTWVHFGAGNIFRAFTAAVLNDVLNSGKYDFLILHYKSPFLYSPNFSFSISPIALIPASICVA